MKKLLTGAIRIYQRYVSPALPRSCRFYPSCSQYALEAIQKYGVIVGGAKALYRVLRCNPICKGGYDPLV